MWCIGIRALAERTAGIVAALRRSVSYVLGRHRKLYVLPVETCCNEL